MIGWTGGIDGMTLSEHWAHIGQQVLSAKSYNGGQLTAEENSPKCPENLLVKLCDGGFRASNFGRLLENKLFILSVQMDDEGVDY